MYSILGKNFQQESHKTGAECPTFFLDLNLDQIIDQVTQDWGQEVRELYYFFPENPEEETWRRAVFHDVKRETVFAAMMEFQRNLRDWKLCVERKEKVEEEQQKHVWYLREMESYFSALESLCASLKKADPSSDGLKGLVTLLSEILSGEQYLALRRETEELWKEFSGFRLLLTYEKERFTVTEGTGAGKYEEFLEECFPDHPRSFRSPFLASDDFSNLEQEILRMFRKKHKEFFVRAEKFYRAAKPYVHKEILALQTEMGYYLSFTQFLRKMQERGFAFCTPGTDGKELNATGLYDLALAIVSDREGKGVVSNDAMLLPDEDFFVLTGPNQGGKTTYARSLGQLVYFTKMGLDVPAETANVPYYQTLWTHFSVEESAETGRGKLMDELARLKPIMDREQRNCFVVINELFTTAANYDANEMGKRVLEYLISQKSKGIYVTHLSELSKARPTVVSLRAGVDEQGKQTYVVSRSEATELAGANAQVEKYGLTYRQLKERFS